jgi:outer membrane murein-binding lipoprotein Lpp
MQIIVLTIVILLAGCSEFEAKIEEMNTTTQNDGLQQ